ncbi:MAG: hypothetical protein ACK4HR_02835 [Hyphomonas sp.]
MKHSVMAIAFVAWLAGCAAMPEAPELNADGTPVEKECRSIQLPGSNIIKRDCKTRVEWAKHDAEEAARNAALLGNSRTARDPYTMR